MNKEKALDLLESIAWLTKPLAKTCEKAIDSAENEEEKKKIKDATKLLLRGHYELIDYIRKNFPELDPNGQASDLFLELQKKYE